MIAINKTNQGKNNTKTSNFDNNDDSSNNNGIGNTSIDGDDNDDGEDYVDDDGYEDDDDDGGWRIQLPLKLWLRRQFINLSLLIRALIAVHL